MPYPDDKETFRRVINQDLPAEPGTVLDENDQNLPADFLERLQDTFGYNIKMGFASVKAFFDDIVTKFAAIKKTEVIEMHQSSPNVLKNNDDHEEYGIVLNLISTDIVLFQAVINWRQQQDQETALAINIDRGISPLRPALYIHGVGVNFSTSSPFQYLYTNPTPGAASYKLRITQQGGQGVWKDISFTAIKVSI